MTVKITMPVTNPGSNEAGRSQNADSGMVDNHPLSVAIESVPRIGTKQWDTMNRQRADLIHKKNRTGLTPEECLILDRLQELSRTVLEQTYPRPDSDNELERVEQRLGEQGKHQPE